MKPLGVNRVTMAVKDLDDAVAFYSRLLGATFNNQDKAAQSLGIRCAISWDAGIELVSPLPGHETFVTKLIASKGEGLIGVVFAVDDVEACRQTAEEMKIRVRPLVDYGPREIEEYLQNRFKKYKEYTLSSADTHGVGPVIGQIEPR
jgi:catechol 2,3-dioxygenase-like lactoylglutathione lyase family enzyme